MPRIQVRSVAKGSFVIIQMRRRRSMRPMGARLPKWRRCGSRRRSCSSKGGTACGKSWSSPRLSSMIQIFASSVVAQNVWSSRKGACGLSVNLSRLPNYCLSVNLSPLTGKMSLLLSLGSDRLCHIKCRCIVRHRFHVCETIQKRHIST